MFKLYILSAVANQIDAGDLKWDQQLTITEQIKSLPTGALQNKPDGTKVGVADAATKMISWCVSVLFDGLECDAAAGDFFQDGVRGRDPDQGFRVLVVDLNVFLNFADQVGH